MISIIFFQLKLCHVGSILTLFFSLKSCHVDKILIKINQTHLPVSWFLLLLFSAYWNRLPIIQLI